MPQDAPGFVTDAVGRDELRVAAELLPVLLVGREAGEGERVGDVARPLGRQEVAVVASARALDQRDPALRETLEGLELGRVDLIAEVTRDGLAWRKRAAARGQSAAYAVNIVATSKPRASTSAPTARLTRPLTAMW